jgi:UDP-N-acetylmuramoylalanine--D-glutamate ligase
VARLARLEGAEVTLLDEGDPTKLANAVQQAQAAGIHTLVGDDARQFQCGPGEYDLCILSPGFDVAWPLPAKFSAAGVPLTGEMEFAYCRNAFPFIAITGTNGKSTTTELIAHIVNECGKRSVPCGNHGISLSEVLLSGTQHDVLALEVSSFQLETIQRFRPHVALWLNFAADHLDRYPDEPAYYRAKYRIFENQTAEDIAVLNASEVLRLGALKARIESFTAHPEHFGVADYVYRDRSFFYRGDFIGDNSNLGLRGKHNMENVLAALAACRHYGFELKQMLTALGSYVAPAHRCELVRTWQGREFINDSKATNLHALESCIRSLETPIVLIAGGKEKGLDYSPLAQVLPGRVHSMVVLGEIAHSLHDSFATTLPCQIAKDMDEAVHMAAAASREGDSVVLSPGTSSFDMYTGYGQRGDHFRSAVASL